MTAQVHNTEFTVKFCVYVVFTLTSTPNQRLTIKSSKTRISCWNKIGITTVAY